jgi:hypothetical protein|tara:strand:- start:2123 stop:3772 length:1650 start_codon:yes stop_codon:yes gene_type:complete
MKTFLEIRESRGDTAVFTFGRFNPPTTGHEKLMDAVAAQAKKNSGAPYYIFASHSENAKKDPLPYVKKIAYMKKMFPKHSRNIITTKDRMVFEIAVSLYNKGHKSIVMVVGSDRVTEFDGLLNKYNGVEGRHGYYGFDNIEVLSAGERDPDAEGVSGMSASKMRSAASANDLDQFKLGLPKGFGDAEKLFDDVRKFMGIRESFIPREETLTEEDVFRDLYVRGEILNIGDEVTDSYSGVSGKVIRRGTNYLTFAEEDGTVYKKWLYELQEITPSRFIKHVMAKSTHKNIYDKALDVLRSIMDRKTKESDGGVMRHGIDYYAQQVARSFKGVDGRELRKKYETKYEEIKKEDPREVGTDARRKATQKMTPGQKVFSFTEHVNCGTPECCSECETSNLIESNEYRVGSEKYFEFFNEKRDAMKLGVLSPKGFDKELLEGDIGKIAEYQGTPVPLDCPMIIEENEVELNSPKVGGPKKYYVYVKDGDKVKKVTFGDTTGLKVKIDDPDARKNFAARHNCDQQTDKTKAGYWSCNLPRYAKQLGLSGGGNFYW